MAYFLYWWKDTNHTDPWTQGYVGISKKLKYRNWCHKTRSEWYRDDLEQVILREGLTKEQAEAWENSFRPKWNIGWNKAPGGNIPPDATGKAPWNKGKELSQETRDKISDKVRRSQSLSGAPWKSSPETRKKQSDAHSGKTLTEEHKARIGMSLLGKKRGPYNVVVDRKRKDVPRYTTGKMAGKINYGLLRKLQGENNGR